MWEDVILTNGKMFCSIHCLCEKCHDYPEQFLDNEIETRDPEGQQFKCDNCGKEK